MKLGDTFGDYKVVRLLGKGGMGEVWLLEGKSGRQVAAKILDAGADHESRKRFLRETQLALGVKHPNLVETYDVGEDPESGLCYILMEYVPGGTLADYIKSNGALAIEDAVAVVEAIAGVLELGRQKGIVHRDIKPANIMFDAEGTPKLADLGIARAGNAGTETTTVTQTGAMIGTPAYMSPEQMLDAHNVDTRADIYSLGVVFFEMLTGQRPNKDDTIVQLMAKAVKGEPLPDVRTLRPEVSASLAQLLNMMVAPDKDGRISTPGQIMSALAIIERGGEFAAHGGEGARRPTATTGAGRAVAPRPPDSSPAGFPKWLIPVLVLAALAGAFFFLAPKKTPTPTIRHQILVKEVVQTNVVEKTVVTTNVVDKTDVKKDVATDVTRKREPMRSSEAGIRVAKANGYSWKYKIVEDGVEITACEKDDKTLFSAIEPTPTEDLEIPSSLDGRPVVSIGRWAFLWCKNMRHVKIPEGVVALHNRGVFFGCSSLESVSFPSSLKELSVCETFSGCGSLKRIEFAGEPPALIDKIGHRANQEMGRLLFRGVPADCIVRVRQAVGGWGREWPVGFASRRAVIPENANSSVLESGDLDIALKTRQPAEKRRNIDPERLADPDATRATQKAFDALFPGWKVSAVLPDNKDTASWAFGYQKNWRGRNDVVTTMPVSGEKPCVLSRKVNVTGKHPVLLMEVASQNWDTDFLLSVRVNRKTMLDRRLICTPDDAPYERIQVPLSQWKDREISVEIEHCCNGWYYEHAFWGRLEIVEGSGKEPCGPVGIASTEVFPRANLKNKKWMRRTPWAYTVREPPANWKDADFDDSRWKHTKKALGYGRGDDMKVADVWQGERIWIRRKFQWTDTRPVYKAVFDLYYDQDIDIYLNGVKVRDLGGWNTSWAPHAAWTKAFASALRQGENVLAFTLRGEKGDGMANYFDCGLTIETRSAAPSTSPLYCVVDLMSGANAKRYPVAYSAKQPAKSWTEIYKSNKLVMKRVEAGRFRMGDGEEAGSERVCRGGAWNRSAKRCASSTRDGDRPDDCCLRVGLRLACPADVSQ